MRIDFLKRIFSGPGNKKTKPRAMDFAVQWFICDVDGNLAQMSSVAGMLPKIVLADVDQYTKGVTRVINALPPIADAIINPGLAEIDPDFFYGHQALCMFYARRGFFDFERTDILNEYDCRYHLVASPTQKLKLDALPPGLANMISPVRYPYSFENVLEIDVTGLVEAG